MIRHRAAEQAAANHHHYYGTGPGQIPPPTPHRQFSNPTIDQQGFWTPHHQNLGIEPISSGIADIGREASPSKRLTYK